MIKLTETREITLIFGCIRTMRGEGRRFTPGRVLLLALVLSSEQQIIQKCIVKAAKNRQRNGDQNNDPYQADGLLVSVRQARISKVSASIRGVRHSEAPLKFH
jgi:hypothetical protein